jgi:pimeloyl-ACP methyl ester carboxylesterase
MPTRFRRFPIAGLALAALVAAPGVAEEDARPLEERVTHGYTDSNGVRIHHASLGEGPLIVMLHGFPDFWYTWRDQMEALSSQYRVVAVDLRGYNLSDKPEGVEQYDMRLLIGDVVAVIRDFGQEKAIICGHDWGGAIAWSFAMYVPQMTERLMICNLPHPNGIRREMSSNPDQQKNSQYARDFQKPDAHETLTAEGLAGWVTDDAARAKYVEAFERSSFEAMLNYYKRNFPRSSPPAEGEAAPPPPPPSGPRVQCSVLMIHGLEDKALLASGLNDTWEWVDGDLTIVTIPGAGHFVQQDASDLVTRTMRAWLNR